MTFFITFSTDVTKHVNWVALNTVVTGTIFLNPLMMHCNLGVKFTSDSIFVFPHILIGGSKQCSLNAQCSAYLAYCVQ